MELSQEKDCTPRCRSSTHAKLIQNCVPAATPAQIKSYAVSLCYNFASVTNEFGRNLLHMVASCGKYEVVEWLIKQCNVDIDVKDLESGWTALHRSFFYGQLSAARALCMNGASLRSIDHEGLSPLDLLTKDRLPYIEYLHTDPSDVYAWGSNFNYNLGLGNSESRNIPEILEVFRKDSVDIKQVQICKFHSVFLSSDGRVFTCGYGHGGRLGLQTEDMSLVPTLVKGLESQMCSQVAAGQDHMLILLENGQVLSCGLNVYHQLGHIPPVERSLVLKPISLKFLKGKKVLGVRAARFHSLIFTHDSVYTFGLNAGQLGHPKSDRTQIAPRQVSGLYAEDCHLTHVEVSDGATVCATSRGDIYLLHEYQIRRIASRQLDIQKLSIVGGHLDFRVEAAGVREGGGLELRVAVLAKSGKVYLWRQNDPYLRRCLFSSTKEILVSDVHINHYTIGLVTFSNECYLGTLTSYKGKRAAPPQSTLHAPSNFSNKPSAGLVVLLNTSDCHIIKVKKLPNIYRATSISSDYKGRNFAVLQSNPKMGLVEVPWLSNSKFSEDFSRLLSEANIHDDFHDIIIKVNKTEFAAHKYILAYRSDYFKKQFAKDPAEKEVIVLENTRPEAFEQVLKFIYTNSCDFINPGFEVKWGIIKENAKKKKSPKTPSAVMVIKELARKLNVNSLAKRLDSVTIRENKIHLSEVDPLRKPSFKRNSLTDLSDVSLVSSDGVVFRCHKCILAARLDYFQSMLGTSWAENTKLGQIPIPIASKVLEAILDFLYTDDSCIVTSSDDVEFLCQVLVISDQLLIMLLKEICEVSLVRLITLKNSGDLLEIASMYNAVQLKRSCMQFISINIAAAVELKILEILSDDVLEELSQYYKNLIPAMQKRKFSTHFSPSQEVLTAIQQRFPVKDTYNYEKAKSDLHDHKSKNRRRCNSWRTEATKDTSLNKSFDEQDVKSIILDILVPEVEELKIDNLLSSSPKEKEVEYLKSPVTPRSEKLGQWIMKCPAKEKMLSLSEIMLKEEKNLATLSKKSNASDMKPIPRMSQKQKKLLKQSEDPLLSSPPSQASCPWYSLIAYLF